MAMESTWKKFEEIELTHSSAHHLMAVDTLLRVNGYARGIDVAKFLDITRGSVSITLHKLIEKGYMVEDENKFLKLTHKGNEYIHSVISKRKIMTKFFHEVLHMDADAAEVEACRIEHIMSKNSIEKLFTFMGFLLSNNEEARIFREGYDNFRFICHTIDDCHVCEETCLMNGVREVKKSEVKEKKK